MNCSEPKLQPFLIWIILGSPWQTDQAAGHCLQPLLRGWAVIEIEKTLGIGVDPDEVCIEGGAVDLGKRQFVREDRLPQLLVGNPPRCAGSRSRGSGNREIAHRPL